MVQLINNFSLTCVESHQYEKAQLACVCDFRINENNCLETNLLKTGSWILIPYASFIAVTSIVFLWYRVYYKGQSLLFPPSRERGISYVYNIYVCYRDLCQNINIKHT